MGAWDVEDGIPDTGDVAAEPVAIVGMVLGYFSALCYLWCVFNSGCNLSVKRNAIMLTGFCDTALVFHKSSRTTKKSPARDSRFFSSSSR